MSRIIRFHSLGGPEVMMFEHEPASEPALGELRVRVEAIGLNRAEVMFRSGSYLEQPRLPATLGYEASAVVEACGEGVEGFAVGDAVSVIPAFSMNDYGVYGERVIVPASAVVQRPADVDPVVAAATWMAYLTAYGALVDIGELAAGESVIVTAAASSVGLAAIDIARHLGARPIATTRGTDKVADLKAAGAADVIVTDQEDVDAALDRALAGGKARLVFDAVAGQGVEPLVRRMTQGGTLFVYGALAPEPTPFPLMEALGRGVSLRGYTLFEVVGDATRFERACGFINAGLAAGHFKPTIDRVFEFDDMLEAHRYMESNQQFGKIVVRVT